MARSLNHARRTQDASPLPVQHPTSTRDTAPALVICVAGSANDRARLSELVSHDVNVLLLSSADDVPGVLQGIAAADTANQDAVVVLPQLRLDSDRRVATWFGHEVDLTPLEYDMLSCLLSKPGKMWSFEALYERVWHTPYLGSRTEIHSLVKRLRGKLRRLNDNVTIEAVRGVGFRLVVPSRP